MPDSVHTFEIYFFGLICFHGHSPRRDADRADKKFAKLIDEPVHLKRIYLNNTSVDLDTDDDVHFRSGRSAVDDPNGTTRVLDSFRDYVPHLADLTVQDVTLNFRTRGARVFLPADGKLAAVDWYCNVGHYELGAMTTPDDCIARVTLLQFETSDPNVTVTYGDNPPVTVSDGWVLIVNAEPSHDGSAPQPGEGIQRKDFRLTQRHILVPPDEDYLARLYEVGTKCERTIDPGLKPAHLPAVLGILDHHHARVSLHPECSNTQWP